MSEEILGAPGRAVALEVGRAGAHHAAVWREAPRREGGVLELGDSNREVEVVTDPPNIQPEVSL